MVDQDGEFTAFDVEIDPFNTSRLAYRFDRARNTQRCHDNSIISRPRSEASQEIPSAEQIHQQGRQCRDQHRGALLTVHRFAGDCGAERDQRGGDRLLPARGKGDAIENSFQIR